MVVLKHFKISVVLRSDKEFVGHTPFAPDLQLYIENMEEKEVGLEGFLQGGMESGHPPIYLNGEAGGVDGAKIRQIIGHCILRAIR